MARPGWELLGAIGAARHCADAAPCRSWINNCELIGSIIGIPLMSLCGTVDGVDGRRRRRRRRRRRWRRWRHRRDTESAASRHPVHIPGVNGVGPELTRRQRIVLTGPELIVPLSGALGQDCCCCCQRRVRNRPGTYQPGVTAPPFS